LFFTVDFAVFVFVQGFQRGRGRADFGGGQFAVFVGVERGHDDVSATKTTATKYTLETAATALAGNFYLGEKVPGRSHR
jgi:hypothetical protein